MSLTNKQIQNIHSLDTETCIEILRECVERLGIVSVNEYCEMTGRKKRVTYLDIESGKLKSIKISEKIYIIIND